MTSLVKGERFIQFEGKAKYTLPCDILHNVFRHVLQRTSSLFSRKGYIIVNFVFPVFLNIYQNLNTVKLTLEFALETRISRMTETIFVSNISADTRITGLLLLESGDKK